MTPKAILLKRLDEMRESLKERDGLLISDIAEDVEKIRVQADRDIEVLKLNRSTSIVREIIAALDRVDEDEYGICIECSEAISAKRLAAIPWASRCIACQEKADNREFSVEHEDANGLPWTNRAAA